MGYWSDPKVISAQQRIFRKLNESDCVTISLDKDIKPILSSMGFVLGEPNDSVIAFDAFLDKLPSTLKRSWQMPAEAELESTQLNDAIISPYCTLSRSKVLL